MQRRYAKEFTKWEQMVVSAAREIVDGDVVFIGVGVSVAAACLAKMSHAPRARVIFESGIIDSTPVGTPRGIADPRLSRKCVRSCGLFYALGIVQGGYVDISLLGAAEVDRHGNINTTVVGDYRRPTIRFPGSGGGNDAASHSKRIVILIPHEKRKLPEEVSFVTSPGYIRGPSDRERVGLKGGGPSRVITDLAVLGFHPKSKVMQLESIHQGVTLAQIRENTGFEIVTPRHIPATEPPTIQQLKLLRSKIDRSGVFTRWRDQ